MRSREASAEASRGAIQQVATGSSTVVRTVLILYNCSGPKLKSSDALLRPRISAHSDIQHSELVTRQRRGRGALALARGR
eukprot:COSAG01_NODE_14413_length_1456_cov_40.344141_4_plen_80_part_00